MNFFRTNDSKEMLKNTMTNNNITNCFKLRVPNENIQIPDYMHVKKK